MWSHITLHATETLLIVSDHILASAIFMHVGGLSKSRQSECGPDLSYSWGQWRETFLAQGTLGHWELRSDPGYTVITLSLGGHETQGEEFRPTRIEYPTNRN